MMTTNKQKLDEFFGEGTWVIKAKGTEDILNKYQIVEIGDMGYPNKKIYYIDINHEYIKVQAKFVKKDNKVKISHHQIAKNLGKCRY